MRNGRRDPGRQQEDRLREHEAGVGMMNSFTKVQGGEEGGEERQELLPMNENKSNMITHCFIVSFHSVWKCARGRVGRNCFLISLKSLDRECKLVSNYIYIYIYIAVLRLFSTHHSVLGTAVLLGRVFGVQKRVGIHKSAL